jgi:hypothetical protein
VLFYYSSHTPHNLLYWKQNIAFFWVFYKRIAFLFILINKHKVELYPLNPKEDKNASK